MANITHIVLTGGPCGGKSTGISIIEQALSDRGYKVFVLEEMATILIKSGFAPWVVGNDLFQSANLRIQMERNKFYERVKDEFDQDVVCLHDRGLMDGCAFIGDEGFAKVLEENSISRTQALDYYDGVFHLVTAANGAEEFYTLENNEARTETAEQAREVDNKLLKCWLGHPHLRVIANRELDKQLSFKEKIENLKTEVFSLMGIPVPLEIERKYLVKMPDIDKLVKKYSIIPVDIIQTYLKNDEDGVEERVRQRGINGEYTFYHTYKKKISGLVREEHEKKISDQEYLSLLYRADEECRPIIKRRYCFLYKGKYFELDVYPFWKDKAILELELSSEDETFELPDDLEIIKDVTDDIEYKNNSLAKR